MFEMPKTTKNIEEREKARETNETKIENLGEQGGEKKDNPQEQNEAVNKNYETIINKRDVIYQQAIIEGGEEKKIAKERDKKILEKHNQVVLDYAIQILHFEKLDQKDLTEGEKKERVIAIISTILHDSDKLNSSLPEHHKGGAKQTKILLETIKGQKIEGIEIDDKIIESCQNAIKRHMNYPFMVEVINKGELFSEPETRADKIVFGADMLANIGAKNVGFRLNNFAEKDVDVAKTKGITQVQAAFENVMQGVEDLEKKEYVTKNVTKSTNELIKNGVREMKEIFEWLKNQGEFEKNSR